MERVLNGKPRHAGVPAFDADGDVPRSRKRGAYQPPGRERVGSSVAYAELHAHSAYSFLDGASTPEELVEEAARLGLCALALTDHDGLYGAVRFAEAAAELDVRTVFGAELSLGATARTERPDPPGPHLLVLARGPEGYRRLSRQLAAAHLAGGEKGKPRYDFDALTEAAGGHWHILTGCRKGHVRQALSQGGPAAAQRALADLVDRFTPSRVSIELTHHGHPLDDERNAALAGLAPRFGVGIVATTGAHFADPSRGRLAMAMAAIRARRSLDSAAGWLAPLGGAHLRSGEEMARLFAWCPEAVTAAAELGERCAFGLQLIAPRLPPFDVPDGHTEDSWLRSLVMAGARERYGPPKSAPRAYSQIEHELKVIAQLRFPGYFLVVHDITRFCRDNDILCQGRGSAANSAVCYALGVTAVDPVANELLFERFLSPARDGPPDIDIDIESDQREKVIQYVYHKYGRDYAAQVANVITYRGRSAVRDMARALGFSPGQQDAWSKQVSHWTGQADDVDGIPEQVIDLATQIRNLPRHLGIHSGGMVICDRPIADVCPVEWARMANRSVLQWDKDDCAAIGLVKFDLLGLGMLSLVADARRHGVAVHGPCVNASLAHATCENAGTEVRLGLGAVRYLGAELAEKLVAERTANGPFTSLPDLTSRVQLSVPQVEALATAGALGCFGMSRREALWAAGAAATGRPDRLPGVGSSSHIPALPGMSELELAAADVWATGVSPDSYPTQFLRADLDAMGVLPAERLGSVSDGDRVLIAGAVTHRQRPATAQGVTFINLEDETGMVNVLCTPGVWARHRKLAHTAPALLIRGQVQNASGAITVVAERMGRLTLAVGARSRDFR